ncbi:MAG TPA: 50S ribosomal protein L27, partial [Candidatus Hydrogenedentes bacterium]|nr:50S ribosomal protein L27 [Candidatus Hydrogenedentota bacterium]
IGGDDTLFALADGVVHFRHQSKQRQCIDVLPAAKAE